MVGLCEAVPEVDGWLSADTLAWNERRGRKDGTGRLAELLGESVRVESLLCREGEKFLRRSAKSRPKDDPLDEVNMLVREVFAELFDPGVFSEKVTLFGLGVPLEDEKGFGSSLVLVGSYSIVLNGRSEPFSGWKADDRDPKSDRS